MNTKIACSAIFAIGLLGAAPATQADSIIRWVDSTGRVHYSDMPPPPDAKRVEERMLKGSSIQMDKLPYATRVAAERYPVTLYTQDSCEPCGTARQYLQSRGVPFSEVKIANTTDGEQAAKLLGKGAAKDVMIPSLLIGGKPLEGYSESNWAAALTTAGYPSKTR